MIDNDAFDLLPSTNDLPLTVFDVIRRNNRATKTIDFDTIINSNDYQIYLGMPKAIEYLKTHVMIINTIVPLDITYYARKPLSTVFGQSYHHHSMFVRPLTSFSAQDQLFLRNRFVEIKSIWHYRDQVTECKMGEVYSIGLNYDVELPGNYETVYQIVKIV